MLTSPEVYTLTPTPSVTTATTPLQNLTNMFGWDATAVITDTTPTAKTYVSGVAEVDRITFATKAGTTDGDYFVIHDYLGGSWAVALDTTGAGANTPTGAAWVAVATANKIYTDISGATTGTDVEVLVATAINALTGFTALITTANSTTHMDCTSTWAGVVTTPAVYSKAGASGTGSVTFGITVTGTVSNVSPTGNTVTVTSHGMATGLKVVQTTSSSLPAGLSGSAEYVIAVDANTLKFATSQANALLGTAIAITGFGVGTQTITPQALVGTLVARKTNAAIHTIQNSNVSPNYFTLTTPTTAATQNISATTLNYYDNQSMYTGLQFLATVTSGSCAITVYLNCKGE